MEIFSLIQWYCDTLILCESSAWEDCVRVLCESIVWEYCDVWMRGLDERTESEYCVRVLYESIVMSGWEDWMKQICELGYFCDKDIISVYYTTSRYGLLTAAVQSCSGYISFKAMYPRGFSTSTHRRSSWWTDISYKRPNSSRALSPCVTSFWNYPSLPGGNL